ncbi:MAG TPA: retropepsin-like aspartic protease [Rhizomicrobium sp.]|jgi:hypothetical protein|nr:retropepsin-like aspartic protease [Rhizomicrobium sp.]
MIRLALFALLLSVMLGQPGHAADCAPLKVLATVKLRHAGRGPLMAVPVHVDGARVSLLLDTAGALSQLAAAVIHEQQLGVQGSKIRIYDMAGNSAAEETKVSRLAIGDLELRDVTMWVLPAHEQDEFRRDFSPRHVMRAQEGLDGVLAADLMANYDVELDFGNDTLKYLSQDHCEGHVIYWNAAASAAVAMQFNNLQISVPVMLDGHSLVAVLDTGLARSAIALDTARSVYGLEPGAGLQQGGKLGPTDQKIYAVGMHRLSFEGVTVDNPVFDVIPDLIRRQTEGLHESATLTLPQILLGMDVLSKLHLYIAFRERKIYLTGSSP